MRFSEADARRATLLAPCCGIAALLLCTPARADDGAPTPFDHFGSNVIDAFTGVELVYYGAAVAITGGMAFSGADHSLRVEVQRHKGAPAWGDTALYAGYLLPLAAPAVYFRGVSAEDPEVMGAGSAVLQALAVTVGTTYFLKWATGRPFPRHGGDPNAPDLLDHPEYAREFSAFPPPWERKLAWPSGHTSTTISIAAALTAYYPNQPLVPLIGYPVALGIGLGMIEGDHHWTSDVIAGALIGHGIGYSIGANFRRARSHAKAPLTNWVLVPLTGEVQGVAVVGTWL